MTSSEDPVAGLKIDVDGRILTCTLNRPSRLNAIDDGLHHDLEQFFASLAHREDVDVVVLRGAGRAFCAGGDIENMAQGLDESAPPGGTFTRGAARLVRALVDVPQVIIAQVHGPAIGLGATLALMCDIVLASDEAMFSDPHVSVGLVAGDGGTVIWPMLMGLNRAKEFLLTGDRLTAEDARGLGLVNHVYAADDLERQTRALAERLAAGAPAAMRWTKAALNKTLRERVNLVLDTSLAFEALSALTEDHREGVHAFLEKRDPRFRGR